MPGVLCTATRSPRPQPAEPNDHKQAAGPPPRASTGHRSRESRWPHPRPSRESRTAGQAAPPRNAVGSGQAVLVRADRRLMWSRVIFPRWGLRHAIEALAVQPDESAIGGQPRRFHDQVLREVAVPVAVDEQHRDVDAGLGRARVEVKGRGGLDSEVVLEVHVPSGPLRPVPHPRGHRCEKATQPRVAAARKHSLRHGQPPLGSVAAGNRGRIPTGQRPAPLGDVAGCTAHDEGLGALGVVSGQMTQHRGHGRRLRRPDPSRVPWPRWVFVQPGGPVACLAWGPAEARQRADRDRSHHGRSALVRE